MHVSIRAVDFVLTHTMRAIIEGRLACALAWAGRHMSRLKVLLSYTTGPGGQVLKSCKIQLHLSDGRKLVIEDIRAEFHLAAERAANRVDRLLRQARRRREPLPAVRALRLAPPRASD